MKKYKNYLLVASLFFIPISVYASTGNDNVPIFSAIIMEAIVTMYWVTDVQKSLSQYIVNEDSRTFFWKLFWGRILVLLIFDFFITTEIAVYDFLGFIIGAIVISLFSTSTDKNPSIISTNKFNPKEMVGDETMPESCPKCGAELTNPLAKYCS